MAAERGQRRAGGTHARSRGGALPRRAFSVALALALAVVATYAPALDGQFLNWDDDVYVTENPLIRTGLSRETLVAVLTTPHSGNWIPLTWLSHALDIELYGLHPRGHHVTALGLHAASTVLLFLALRRLTDRLWESAAVAALFALHPLHVESVAWLSERKDVLSTLFWCLAMLAYARYVERPATGRYLAVVGTLALGLLSKPMLVTLPFVLLLLDHWPLGRLTWRAVGEKIPLLLVGLAGAGGAWLAQRGAGAMEPGAGVGVLDRLANAVFSYAEYLRLTVWPVGLSPWYSHPAIEGPRLTPWAIGGATLVLLAISGLAVGTVRRRPYVAVGWLWYLGTLLPVIGVVQIGAQGMADRYTYVPLIGIFIGVVWLAGELPWWRHSRPRRVATASTFGLLVLLAALASRQTRVWHDSATFWSYTLRVNPRASVGHYSVANMLVRERRPADAVRAYRRAIKLRPDRWNWHAEVGDLLYGHGRLAAAGAHYRRAIALRPDEPVLRNALANVLLRQERFGAARRQLEVAIVLRPAFAEAHNNLGFVHAREGRLHEAAAELETALRLRPGLASARANLAEVRAALAAAGDDPT